MMAREAPGCARQFGAITTSAIRQQRSFMIIDRSFPSPAGKGAGGEGLRRRLITRPRMKALAGSSAQALTQPSPKGRGLKEYHLLTIQTCAPGKPLSVGTRRTTQTMV